MKNYEFRLKYQRHLSNYRVKKKLQLRMRETKMAADQYPETTLLSPPFHLLWGEANENRLYCAVNKSQRKQYYR